jgi:hypothetical protein
VKKGTIMIGILNLIGVIAAIFTLNILDMALRLFTAVWFVLMVYKDCQAYRLYFFVSYVIQEIIIYIIEAYVFY